MSNNELRIALLIDGDNAQAELIESLLEILDKQGTCVIRRVYGDWTAPNMAGWRKLEQTHAIQLVQQSRYTKGKNATDIAIAADAVEILHSGKVDAFCLASSDSDFTPLVVRLQDKGATVIVAGKSTTPKSFVNACSVFIVTDTLIPAKKLPAKAPQPKIKAKSGNAKTTPDARSLLHKAYEMTAKKDGWVFLGELGQSLRQLDPKFKTKSFGQKGLSQLVLQYQDLFETRTEKGKGKITHLYIKLKS